MAAESGRVVQLPVAPRLWHVTVSVGGAPTDPDEVRSALERLALERPFLLSARYSGSRAEVRYWEEARCLDDAAALALRIWGEHRVTAQLPPWQVVGLEVLDRETYQWRARAEQVPALMPAGGIAPFRLP